MARAVLHAPNVFYVVHRYGASEVSPRLEVLTHLLDELVPGDERADVWVAHESGWSLSVFSDGVVIWGNPARDDVPHAHMRGVPREKIVELWKLLARGEIAPILAEPWQPGVR